MRTFILVSALLLIATAARGGATDPARALEFFTGACWSGTFADGETTDTHCFQPVFGGVFVRDNHVVRGARPAYAGETLYRWNPTERRFDYTYWDSNGGVSRGALVPDGNSLLSPAETYTDADGATRQIVSRWTITGDDTWEQSAEEPLASGRRLLWVIRYRRVADPGRLDEPCLSPCREAPGRQ
ncbi:MAG: hypothetical protein AAFX58_13950 [Pseudomonadota bacterium]